MSGNDPRVDEVLTVLRAHLRRHPGQTVGQIINQVAEALNIEVSDMADSELLGALELGIVAIPADLPPKALACPVSDTDWASRPDSLQVLRLHSSRKWLRSDAA